MTIFQEGPGIEWSSEGYSGKRLTQIYGLALSDADHVLGLQVNWSRQAVCHGLTISGRWNGKVSWNDKTRKQEIQGYNKKILDAVVSTIIYLALETQADRS